MSTAGIREKYGRLCAILEEGLAGLGIGDFRLSAERAVKRGVSSTQFLVNAGEADAGGPAGAAAGRAALDSWIWK